MQRKIGLNADLFLATLYLSQVYYDAPGEEKAIRAALDKLVNHICLTQGKDGTWGNESWVGIQTGQIFATGLKNIVTIKGDEPPSSTPLYYWDEFAYGVTPTSSYNITDTFIVTPKLTVDLEYDITDGHVISNCISRTTTTNLP